VGWLHSEMMRAGRLRAGGAAGGGRLFLAALGQSNKSEHGQSSKPERPERAEPRPERARGAPRMASRAVADATAATADRPVKPKLARRIEVPNSAATESIVKKARLRAQQATRSAAKRPRPAMKPASAKLRAASPRRLASPSPAEEVGREQPGRPRAVNALHINEEAARSASPCSPEAPGRPRRAADNGRSTLRRARDDSEGALSERSSHSSGSSSLAEVLAVKKPRLLPAEQVAPASEKLGTPSPKGGVRGASSGPSADSPGTVSLAATFKSGSGDTFQTAVLERLNNLCGEHEDAKVLAEYIVVMVAGNKGREEMASELRPFFSDQAQADSFVDWVEECKWKFLTGGPSPQNMLQRNNSSPPVKNAKESAQTVPAATRAMLTPNAEFQPLPRAAGATSAGATVAAVRPGPHVAVTNRVVLQPNPHFDASPMNSSPASGVTKGSPSAPTPMRQTASSPGSFKGQRTAVASANPVKREKNELLENMTKQLQVILTKLNDRSLNDETREKYQAMAQSIQTQMAKISRPQAPTHHRRR